MNRIVQIRYKTFLWGCKMIDVTNQMIYRLGNLNTESQRISYQMSTGKKLDRGSDDTGVYARELYINDKIRIYEGLQTQIEKTHAQNVVSDSSISEVKLSMDSIKSEILKSLNAGMDPSDKLAVAVNINGIRENLLTLANEATNGEFIFAGSDTTVRPFIQDDATGKIFYNGDAQLRSIAVAPNTYRDRGVTGYDVFMYTSSEATQGNTFSFNANDMIIDERGLQWHATKAFQDGRLTFDASDTIVDDNGDTWALDVNTNTLTQTTDTLSAGTLGRTINVELVEGNQYRTVSIHDDHVSGGTGAAPAYLQVSGAVQLRQNDINGSLTGETYTLNQTGSGTATDPYMFETTTTLGTTNQVLTAKHSFFDDIDTIITALQTNTNDDTGSTIGLRSTLNMVASAYDAANIGHSVLGARNRIFELAQDSVASKLTHYNILYQEVAGADLSKVAMESKALEMTYTALYSTISKMNDLSLVNFVR